MAKKALLLLLALSLAAPSVLACDCCPAAPTPSSTSGIQAETCGCCATAEINRSESNLNREIKPLSILSSSHCEARRAEAICERRLLRRPEGLLAMTDGLAPPSLSLQILRI